MTRLAVSLLCCLGPIFLSDANGTELIGDIPEDVALELKEVFSEGVLVSVGFGYVRHLEPEDNRYLQSIENDGGEFVVTYGQRNQ